MALTQHAQPVAPLLRIGSELRNQTKLDPKLRELALMHRRTHRRARNTSSSITGISRGASASREQLERSPTWERSPAFNEHERAVIRYAVEATNNIRSPTRP